MKKPQGKVSRIEQAPVFIREQDKIIGYGSPELRVESIESWLCRTIITAKHYSGRFVNNGYVHLGIFNHRHLIGVMQWGYALNPNNGRRIVIDTGNRDYLELNRLWVHDRMPRNTEFRALSYALKYVKQAYPSVQWVQSFADERYGGAGIIYQACSFDFIGCHETTFYQLDEEWYHEINKTAIKRGGKRGQYLRDNFHRATTHKFKQYRYIKFLKRAARKRLNTKLFKIRPYPKPDRPSEP